MIRKLFTASLIGLFLGAQAHAANLPLLQGPYDPGNALGFLNALIQEINQGIATNPGVLVPKNVLDNGNFAIAQRGTATLQTCGTTTIPETAYSADRWGCNVNVTSGAGTLETVTSSPSPMVGSLNSLVLYRTSGALLQPQCVMQEVPQNRVLAMQGQTVDFSIYAQALSGLAADNGNAANLYVFTGTTADQGLQSFTASPAITPAWAGIATPGSVAVTLTTAWARYQTGPVPIAPTINEIAVAVCFTPTATGAGSTDGLALSDAQLEPLGSNVQVASGFEAKDPTLELATAQKYYYRIVEPAAGIAVGGNGTMLTTTTCALNFTLPQTMFKAPVFSHTGTFSTSTFQIVVAADTSTLASTFLVSPSAANTANVAALVATLTTGSTAGWACQLQGAAGTSSLIWGADF